MLKVALIALALSFCAGCTHLIYAPTRVKHVDERRLSHSPEEHRFAAPSGEELAGWYFKSVQSPPKGVLVFFHGNGQNLSSHFQLMYWILNHGYDFFIFDYPGYGISEGSPTPRNTVESGMAAMRWTAKHTPGVPMIVYGQSLGGAVAMRTLMELKGEIPICQLVLDSTFQSYSQAARNVLAQSYFTWLLQPLTYLLINDSWSPKGRLDELKGYPAAVVHSEKDPIVRFERGREVYEALPGPKVFWTLHEPGHTHTFVGPEKEPLRKELLEELARNCERPSR